MSKKKIMPQTLLNIHKNPLMKKIMDRTENLDETIEKVRKFWSFDMYSRTPSLIDSLNNITNLDVACFIYSLCERSAIITIPEYESLRPQTLNETKSTGTRTGKIIGLSSNKDLFSFSIKIFDESVNDFRNFCITDPCGNLHLKFLKWVPVDEENIYLVDNKVSFENQINFRQFIHPNRWASFYGQHYFITKALIDRMTDQCKNWFSQIKRMKKNGIEYPQKDAPKIWPKVIKEAGVSVKFESLEVEVDFPMINEYKKYDDEEVNMVKLTDMRKYYLYTLLPILRFATRCTELAFYKYSKNKLPSWIGGGTKWEKGFKLPKKKIIWDRLKIVQPKVGNYSLSIRKRIKMKSEIMNKNWKKV